MAESKPCAKCKKVAEKGKKFSHCGGCGEVFYCSATCQRSDWKEHKSVCKKKHKRKSASHLVPRSAQQEKVSVLWEDQRKINEFGRLNQRLLEVVDEIKKKELETQSLDDARDEIQMCIEDDGIMRRVGECFVSVEEDDAEEFVDASQANAKEVQTKLSGERSDLEGRMEKLKIELYAKFGDSINLENTRDDGK
eukprot:34113_1